MNSNDKNINDLIKQASMKAGVDPNALKQNVDNGKLDALISRMNPQDAQRFKAVLGNPLLAQQMLNTPQAQALIKKFMQ